jgi:hypothetical protein
VVIPHRHGPIQRRRQFIKIKPSRPAQRELHKPRAALPINRKPRAVRPAIGEHAQHGGGHGAQLRLQRPVLQKQACYATHGHHRLQFADVSDHISERQLIRIIGSCEEKDSRRKRFFFKKKKQKTFGPGGAGPAVAKAPSKRKFFASFFKKEALAFFP